MTVAVIARLIDRSARPGTSVTVATMATVPVMSCPGVIVTVPPPLVTVAPAGWLTPSTWMSGWASGLVTYWPRLTVTLWPASTVTLTARPVGGGALMTTTLTVPPPGSPAPAPAGMTCTVPVLPGAAPLPAVSSRLVPPGTLALTPPAGLVQDVLYLSAGAGTVVSTQTWQSWPMS